MKEIRFVVDDSVKKAIELDRKISDLIRYNPEIENAAEFLIDFTRACVLASDKLKEKIEIEKPKIIESEFSRLSYVVVSYSDLDLVKVSVGKVNNSFLYFIDEKRPDEDLLKYVRHFVGFNLKKLSDFKYLRKLVIGGCDKLGLEFEEEMVLRIYYFVYRSYFSLLRLDPLLRDGNVRSIHCDGLYKPVKIYYSGISSKVNTNLVFSEPKELNLIIERLAKLCGVVVSKENPVLDAGFSSFRVHAVLGTDTLKPRFVVSR